MLHFLLIILQYTVSYSHCAFHKFAFINNVLIFLISSLHIFTNLFFAFCLCLSLNCPTLFHLYFFHKLLPTSVIKSSIFYHFSENFGTCVITSSLYIMKYIFHGQFLLPQFHSNQNFKNLPTAGNSAPLPIQLKLWANVCMHVQTNPIK